MASSKLGHTAGGGGSEHTTGGSQTWLAFAVFLVARLLAARYAPIQDCDEVFNFWEPSHYLAHGSGLQTWELSPEHAIRSWLYSALHALPMWLASRVRPLGGDKSVEFYALRALLAAGSAACDARLFAALARAADRRLAWCFVLAAATGAGMFHASIAYLPSSFVMYTTALGAAAFLERDSPHSVARGLGRFALGTVVGWPFAGALALPFVAGEVLSSLGAGDLRGLFFRLLDGAARSLSILAVEIVVDSLFYRKPVCVPFNIVWYNVLSGGDGPNIYGTEPWHFYLRNLAINFGLWFALACAALPLLVLHRAFAGRPESRLSLLQSFVITSPFYLWLAIFTLQPHKEERFMYPAYPLLAINAAFSLHIVMIALGGSSGGARVRLVPVWLRLLAISAFILVAALLGVWRSVGLATAYGAPLALYDGLRQSSSLINQTSGLVNVCVGKEWYRFPSSYHLPSNARLRFIKSDFSGLLPGAFDETPSTPSDPFPGTRIVPQGMNDQNIEDMGKYIDVSECHYLVDSWSESAPATKLEPSYVEDRETWEVEECLPFMDAGTTGLLGRLFWIPETRLVPAKYRRRWGKYCLLRRKG